MTTKAIDLRSLQSNVAKIGARGYWAMPAVPTFISFDSGVPDADTFPREDLLAATERVLRGPNFSQALDYTSGGPGSIPYGYEGLRELLCDWALREDGKKIGIDSIMLTSGGAQAISLVLGAFLNPGDALFVEAPTWGYVLRDAKVAGAKVIPVSMDSEGMLMDELEEKLKAAKRDGLHPKALYTIANFNTPTGISMSLSRRKRLVQLAQEWQIVVLQDDTYGDLRYEGQHIPSLFSLDDSGVVVKLKSFSKILAAGYRLGWVVGHPDVLQSLVMVRRDLGVGQMNAHIIAEYMRAGKLDEHMRFILDFYRNKRDKMKASLAEFCTPYLSWNNPDGGFYLWAEFADNIDGKRLAEETGKRGIRCRPGESFYEGHGGSRNFRIAFARAPIADIEKGMQMLGDSLALSVKK